MANLEMKIAAFIIVTLILLGIPTILSENVGTVTLEEPSPTSHPVVVMSTPIPHIKCTQVLSIPTIKLCTEVYPVGIKDGRMDVPDKYGVVGWFKDGYKIGQIGNAVIDGHVDSRIYGEAIFYHLKDLHIGDKVFVDNLKFLVIDIQIYNKDEAPTNIIFGNCGYKGLNLITCTGTFYKAKCGGYDKRLVVYCKEEL